MNAQATKKQIRNSFTNSGHTVKISNDGHITFKRNGDGPWSEGRFVSEYFIDENGKVYHK